MALETARPGSMAESAPGRETSVALFTVALVTPTRRAGGSGSACERALAGIFCAFAEAAAAPLGERRAGAPPVEVAAAVAEPDARDTVADAAAVAAPPASKAPPVPKLLPIPPCPPVEFAVAEADPVALDAAAPVAFPPLPPVPGASAFAIATFAAGAAEGSGFG